MLLNIETCFVSEVHRNEFNVEIHFTQTRLNKALIKVQKHMSLSNAGTHSSFPLLSSVILGPVKLVFPGRS